MGKILDTITDLLTPDELAELTEELTAELKATFNKELSALESVIGRLPG